MSNVTVSIDHFPTEPISEQRWVDIAIGLLHSDEYAIHTRTVDVASLLAEVSRLTRELDQAREDMSARWENSDHLAAKYWRRMQEARADLENADRTIRALEPDTATYDRMAREHDAGHANGYTTGVLNAIAALNNSKGN